MTSALQKLRVQMGGGAPARPSTPPPSSRGRAAPPAAPPPAAASRAPPGAPPLRSYDPTFDPTATARQIAGALRTSRTLVVDVLPARLLGRSATVVFRSRPALADLAHLSVHPDGHAVVVAGELPDEAREAVALALLPKASGGKGRAGGVDTHWVGTCGHCMTPLRVTTRALDRKDAGKGLEVVGGPLGTEHVLARGDPLSIAVTCPTCHAHMHLLKIEGEKTHTPCNASCMFARGPICECACGGENHAIGFAGLLLFPGGTCS